MYFFFFYYYFGICTLVQFDSSSQPMKKKGSYIYFSPAAAKAAVHGSANPHVLLGTQQRYVFYDVFE